MQSLTVAGVSDMDHILCNLAEIQLGQWLSTCGHQDTINIHVATKLRSGKTLDCLTGGNGSKSFAFVLQAFVLH